MPTIEVAPYERCISTLTKAYALLQQADPNDIMYDLYRSACIKEFEIILEQTGKLLKRALKPYFHSNAAANQLYFKDIFRHSVSHGLISVDMCDRWMEYRDNRNSTAHDYGSAFAEETLLLLPRFIADAQAIAQTLNTLNAHDPER